MLSNKDCDHSSTGPDVCSEVSAKNPGNCDIDDEVEEKLNCDQFVDATNQHACAWHTMLAQHSEWIQFRANLSSASANDLINSLYKTQLVPKC